MKVMVTGHRPQKLGGWKQGNPTEQWVRGSLGLILSCLKDRMPGIVAISGCALGVDQWWAEEALTLGIPVIAAIPFKGQDSTWPKARQKAYRDLLDRCSEIVYVNDPGYEPWKMQARNIWMIENSDLAIAVWDGSGGGTANTVKELRRRGIGFIHVDPVKRRIGSSSESFSPT